MAGDDFLRLLRREHGVRLNLAAGGRRCWTALSGSPLEGHPEDDLVHRALPLQLILTNSDRRAEAPKRGQDHKSHPSRCLVGRVCPPDNLQVPIDFLSGLPHSPLAPLPAMLLCSWYSMGQGLSRWTWVRKLARDSRGR